MKTLCLDTSFSYLTVVLLKDKAVVQSFSEPCPRQQSELLLPTINDLYQKAGWKPNDTDEVLLTIGPGSYTGTRIALTAAKMFTVALETPLKTLSTLQLLSGGRDGVSVLDARANRVYLGAYKAGIALMQDTIMSVEEAKLYCQDKTVFGQGSILEKNDDFENMAARFVALYDQAVRVNDPLHLEAVYLKSAQEYTRKP